MFDYRRITLFCLEKRFSKHKMTIFSKNFGGHGPFGPPGYAYGGTLKLSLSPGAGDPRYATASSVVYFFSKCVHVCCCNVML